jgi:Bacterial capsule synthesis protein PGA_cap
MGFKDKPPENLDSRTLTVTAVGDIMLGDNALHIGRGVASTWRQLSLEDQLGLLKPYLSGNIVIGNLECVLGAISSKNPKRRAYIAPASRAKELKNIGFTHLGLANNHILEHGFHAATHTRNALEDAGVIVCGPSNPVIHTINGKLIAIFNYSLTKERFPNVFYKNRVTQDDLLQIESSSADYKIVFIHWGDEYSLYPSNTQIELGHEFLRRGAVLVFGHHPHVIQGIEKRAGGLIAYSLGNFIFDQNWSEETQTGLILRVVLNNSKVASYTMRITKQDIDFVPRLIRSNLLQDLNSRMFSFTARPDRYAEYVKRRENWARMTMKKEMFKNLTNVSLATLMYPIIRRSATFERLFFPK